MDLEIVLNADSDKPLYEQIYLDIRERIRSGDLIAGERLPSTRVMAQNLHVARSTAEFAYEQLEAEGYIEKRPGSGAYVCDIENIPELLGVSVPDRRDPAGSRAGNETRGRTGHAGDGLPAASGHALSSQGGVRRKDSPGNSPHAEADRTAGEVQTEKCADASDIRIDFSPRTIDMSAFPYATWRRILRGILTGDRSDLFSRGDPQGDIGLRTTIARYLHLSRGCRCTPDQLVIGAGNDYLMMLLTMILGEGRRIGMESPTYLRAAGIAAAMHDTVVPVRSDGSGMDVRALTEADCSLAYCMPTRQYPTGTSMPWPRRSQLLNWAASAPDRYIIEDDYDSEFKYRGRPVPSLQSQDTAGRVIYMGTFSKSIAPAVRVSYLILPPSLAGVFRARAGILSCTVPRMDQAILDEFIRDGYFERYLNRMRSRYRAKHDLMLDVLTPLTEPGPGARCSGSAEYDQQLTVESGPGARCSGNPAVTSAASSLTEQEPGPGMRAPRFKLRGAGAGLHLVLEVSDAAPPLPGETARGRNLRIETDLAQRAAAAGVRVYPMSEAYLDGPLPEGQNTPPSILLGYASLSEDEIREGACLLAKAWGM